MPFKRYGIDVEPHIWKCSTHNGTLSIWVCIAFHIYRWLGRCIQVFRILTRKELEDGKSGVTLGTYLKSGHLIQAALENWESEFLQMALFVDAYYFITQNEKMCLTPFRSAKLIFVHSRRGDLSIFFVSRTHNRSQSPLRIMRL